MMKKRILVVDDEGIVARDIAESLEAHGYEVVGTAMNAPDALAKAREFYPDLVLMDIVLQGEKDGVDAAVELRTRYGIPVLFLTAYSHNAVVERAKRAEPLGYLLKPFDDDTLHSTVEIALNKAAVDRQITESRDLFHTTLKCIADAVISTGPQGGILFMNEAASKISGWSRQEAYGMPVSKMMRFAVSEDGEVTFLITREGRQVPVVLSSAQIKGNNDRISGSVLVFRDNTAAHEAAIKQREIHAELERLVRVRTAELENSNTMLQQEIGIRQLAESALRSRLDIEETLSSIASDFALVSQENIGRAIHYALGHVGEYLRGTRAFVALLSPDKTALNFSYEWARTGEHHLPPEFDSVATADVPWSMSRLQLLHPIIIRSHADLPPVAVRELELIRAVEATAAVAMPFSQGAELTGMIVVFHSDAVAWKDEDLRLLRMTSLLVSNAIARIKAERDRVKLHEQLVQSQKMEAVGKLTGGIAHDFNNMLVPILGFSDMLLATSEPGSRQTEILSQIQRAAMSAAGLAKQLLTFGKKQKPQRKPDDLNALIQQSEKILRRVIGANIAFDMRLGDSLPLALVNGGQFEQVLMNLTVNAAAAMPDGGRLTIATRIEEHVVDVEHERCVCVEVTDTGTGMPPAVLARIFEPFFTTKGTSGTGLGLSVVRSIIEEHGGKITATSAPGHGTTMRVYFPVTAEKADAESETNTAFQIAPDVGAGKSILIIEDESSVTEFLSQVLSGSGFRVTSARTAQEALRHFAKEAGRFDVVFSDIVLPDGSGIDLVRSLSELRRDLRVVLTSGYEDKQPDFTTDDATQFIAKPYSLNDLIRAIDRAMK